MKRVNQTFWQFVSLTIVFLGLVTGLILVPMVQDIREEASVLQGSATVKIDPVSGSFNTGDIITANILFNSSNIAISGIAVRLSYPFSGTVPEVKVTSIDINPALLSSGEWTCPTKDSILNSVAMNSRPNNSKRFSSVKFCNFFSVSNADLSKEISLTGESFFPFILYKAI